MSSGITCTLFSYCIFEENTVGYTCLIMVLSFHLIKLNIIRAQGVLFLVVKKLPCKKFLMSISKQYIRL